MTAELLTPNERHAVALAGQLAEVLAQIVGTSRTSVDDLNELLAHVHVIQNAVLAQAAARAYPGQYRRLGAVLDLGVPL